MVGESLEQRTQVEFAVLSRFARYQDVVDEGEDACVAVGRSSRCLTVCGQRSHALQAGSRRIQRASWHCNSASTPARPCVTASMKHRNMMVCHGTFTCTWRGWHSARTVSDIVESRRIQPARPGFLVSKPLNRFDRMFCANGHVTSHAATAYHKAAVERAAAFKASNSSHRRGESAGRSAAATGRGNSRTSATNRENDVAVWKTEHSTSRPPWPTFP